MKELWKNVDEREKIYSVIKRIKKYHGLKWLRVKMSDHRFPNLGEILQGDMLGKLRKRIRSEYLRLHR